MPRASETMATEVTKGVLKRVRKANVKLRITALDGPEALPVYRLGSSVQHEQQRHYAVLRVPQVLLGLQRQPDRRVAAVRPENAAQVRGCHYFQYRDRAQTCLAT